MKRNETSWSLDDDDDDKYSENTFSKKQTTTVTFFVRWEKEGAMYSSSSRSSFRREKHTELGPRRGRNSN